LSENFLKSLFGASWLERKYLVLGLLKNGWNLHKFRQGKADLLFLVQLRRDYLWQRSGAFGLDVAFAARIQCLQLPPFLLKQVYHNLLLKFLRDHYQTSQIRLLYSILLQHFGDFFLKLCQKNLVPAFGNIFFYKVVF